MKIKDASAQRAGAAQGTSRSHGVWAGKGPGKNHRKTYGPRSVISPTKQAAVARTAMNLKKRGGEPTYAAAVAQNREALTNPATGEPVHKKRYYQIISSRCYDEPVDKKDTWRNRRRYSKNALIGTERKERHLWADGMLAKKLNMQWWSTHVVWTDICNTLLPRSCRRSEQMAMARKGGRGWSSVSTAMQSQNLGAPP